MSWRRMMDANDKVAQLANQASVQCRRSPMLRQLCVLMRPVVLLLAEGHPVSINEVAEVAGWPAARVARVLHSSPDAEWTATGLLSGLCVTLQPTPHRLTVGGPTMHVWCAFHALTIPAILGKEAHLESTCIVTGTRIEFDVSADGFAIVEPATAVIAVRTCAENTPTEIVPSCVHQALFRDIAVTARWADDHPDHKVLSVRDASRYARLVTSC